MNFRGFGLFVVHWSSPPPLARVPAKRRTTVPIGDSYVELASPPRLVSATASCPEVAVVADQFMCPACGKRRLLARGLCSDCLTERAKAERMKRKRRVWGPFTR